jgi:hypothetical protein
MGKLAEYITAFPASESGTFRGGYAVSSMRSGARLRPEYQR